MAKTPSRISISEVENLYSGRTIPGRKTWLGNDGEDLQRPQFAEDKEPDPFEKADSPSAIMAYVHAKMGKDGLKALLSQVETDKESLERDANELAEVGLPDVAAIVLEAAANALPAQVMHCPYAEDDLHNYQSWIAAYQRRHSK